MNNYEYSKFDYETELIDNRKNQITDVYENELKFANTIPTASTHGKMIAELVLQNANLKERIHDLLKENTEWKLENEKLTKKSYKDDVIITKITEIINNLKPLTEEETGIKEMLKLAYSADNIKNLETSFKTICHLEDFEIAIWNIKDLLSGDDKSEG